jgi:CubicO group peptidase (beta-lactamase class C family)
MQRLFLVFIVFGGIFIPSVCRSQTFLPDSIIEKLRIGAKGFMERYHSPSIVIAIVQDKDVIFQESLGYSDVEHKIPSTVYSPYSIQSLTKVFTATMLMQLVQKGIVTLDDDVTKYVPEYKGDSYISNGDGTTLFQLATHTSGLPRNSPADINFTKQVDRWMLGDRDKPVIEAATKKEFLRSLAFIRKEYPDYSLLSYGDRHYSNLGYALLGIAAERAAKMDYTSYVMTNICKPLHMDSSRFYSEPPDLASVAKGYYYRDSTKDFIRVPVFKPNSAMPAAGMFASANDLTKFISFQFETTNGTQNVLSSKNEAKMRALSIAWKPSYPFVFHEGAMLGFRCELALNPGIKLGWIILTNTTDFDFKNKQIHQRLAGASIYKTAFYRLS